MHTFFWSLLLLLQAGVRGKYFSKNFLGENTGLNVKVLVLDVKVLVYDVEVLFLGCGSTGPRIWKYWSLDVSNRVRKCCRRS